MRRTRPRRNREQLQKEAEANFAWAGNNEPERPDPVCIHDVSAYERCFQCWPEEGGYDESL